PAPPRPSPTAAAPRARITPGSPPSPPSTTRRWSWWCSSRVEAMGDPSPRPSHARFTRPSSSRRWPWPRWARVRDPPDRPPTPSERRLAAARSRPCSHLPELHLALEPLAHRGHRLPPADLGGRGLGGPADRGRARLSQPRPGRARLLRARPGTPAHRLHPGPDRIRRTPLDPSRALHRAAVGAVQAHLRAHAGVGPHLAVGSAALPGDPDRHRRPGGGALRPGGAATRSR